MSESTKRLWLDIGFKSKMLNAMMGGWAIRPNKPETKLFNLLESIQTGDWKYVGDGSFIIAGKNPDFVNVNGKKLIIELFGNYWHRGQNPQDRINIFKPFGFRTLVVWEHELKSEPELVERICEFGGETDGT